MAHPLMPKAAAVWLIENTTLTFDQIAEFSGLHSLEVQAIADDEVAIGMQGMDPVATDELTIVEIERCQADPDARLVMATPNIPRPQARTKGARYTPVSKRQDRPDAIAWLVKTHPELTDGQISKLVGTTKPTIGAIRDRTHWNITNIKPQNPVGLGMCSAIDLGQAVEKARARIANAEKRRIREENKTARLAAEKTPKAQEALPAPEQHEALAGPPPIEQITDQSQKPEEKPEPDQG